MESVGYEGTVNEEQWAALARAFGADYSVAGPTDWKVSITSGDRRVAIAPGSGSGCGVQDTESVIVTKQHDPVASGSRWDTIVARRDWTPENGGLTTFEILKGGTSAAIPASRLATPGVKDDQPLALVRLVAGQQAPAQVIDLRCWYANGGLHVADPAALQYLTRLGTVVHSGTVRWSRQVAANGTPVWVRTNDAALPVFGAGMALRGTSGSAGYGTAPADADFLIQAGTVVHVTDGAGYARVTFPRPFPNGLLIAQAWNGDGQVDDLTLATTATAWGLGGRDFFVYRAIGSNGGGAGTYARVVRTGLNHRANWLAIGW